MFGSELTGVPIGRGIYLGTQERRTQVPRSKVRRNIKKKKKKTGLFGYVLQAFHAL